jgi:subtilisin family serine protease
MKKNKRIFIAGWSIVAMMSAYPSSVLCKRVDEELIDKANSTGSVRVIARLDVDYKTEGKLSSTASVEKQRTNIAEKQKGLLERIAVHKIKGVKKFKTIPHIAMEVDADGLRELLANSDVVSIEEDIPVPPVLNQSVPFIKANQVHTNGYDGTGWTVAVLDTGVRKTHEFLSGKVVSEACYSTTGSSSTSLCPGGSNSIAAGSGVNCSTSISSGCSHGTHVAGIIAGKSGTTVAKGIAPGAKIIAIQVFSKFNNSADCGDSPVPCVRTYTSDQLLGLERVYALRSAYKIAAVNMSLGGGKYSSYCDTDSRKAVIDNLRSAGVATVIASGNDEWNSYVNAPGCISSAVTVGATLDNANTVSSYSNYAAMVDLMAPGSSIISSTAISDVSYILDNGTSMAAPHVAGAFAVMKSKNSAWKVDDIETRLKDTGVSVTRANITKPRIDLLGATNYDTNNLLPAVMSVIDNVIIKQ